MMDRSDGIPRQETLAQRIMLLGKGQQSGQNLRQAPRFDFK